MCRALRYGFRAAQVIGGGMKIPAELDPRFRSKVSGGILAKAVSEAVRACRLIYAKPCCRQWNYHHKILHRHFKEIFSILCAQYSTCLIHIRELVVCTFEKPFTIARAIENQLKKLSFIIRTWYLYSFQEEMTLPEGYGPITCVTQWRSCGSHLYETKFQS